MLSREYRKFAKELGLRCTLRRAYGSLGGYAVTFYEEYGYKSMNFVVRSPYSDALPYVAEILQPEGYTSFSILHIKITQTGIDFTFLDEKEVLSDIRKFVDWICPALDTIEATHSDVCFADGQKLEKAHWMLIDGIAHPVHPACRREVVKKLREEDRDARKALSGSFAKGALGAFLGALVGAFIFVVFEMLGWNPGVVWIFTGWYSVAAYCWLGGKCTRGMIPILLLTLLPVVIAGDMLGIGMEVYMEAWREGSSDMGLMDMMGTLGIMICDGSAFTEQTGIFHLVGFFSAVIGAFCALMNREDLFHPHRIRKLR